MFVSFHSKLALNAEPGCPSSFSGGAPLLMSRTFANGLCVPVNMLSGDRASNLASRGSRGDQLCRARLFLVGPSVPTNRVHCKADPQAMQKSNHRLLSQISVNRCACKERGAPVAVCTVCTRAIQ